MKRLARYWVIVLLGYSVTGSLGCTMIMEGAKGIAGLSTKVLEDKRSEALVETFKYKYNACYERTKKILGGMGVYIYAENPRKKLIAVYVSETNTTPVGIFFKEIDTDTTQVEVSSASTSAKELIAGKLFTILKGKKYVEPVSTQTGPGEVETMSISGDLIPGL